MTREIEFFVASSGTVSARVYSDEDKVKHLHSTVRPEDESRYFEDMTLWGDIIVFAGIGLGHHIKKALSQLSSHSRIIVIDIFEECIKRTLESWPRSIREKAHAFHAAMAPHELPSLLSGSEQSPSLRLQIVKHPASFHVDPAFYNDALNRITAFVSRQHTPPRRQCRPLLCFGSHFLENELSHALGAVTGEQVQAFHYKKFHDQAAWEQGLQQAIEMASPSYLLSVNMKGFDGNGQLSAITQRRGIPLMVWFVDDPRPILLHQGNFVTPNMIALCWERAYLPFLNQYPFSSAHYLPLAADLEMFNCDFNSNPRYDFAFAGSSMAGRFLADVRAEFLYSQAFEPVIQQVSDRLFEDASINIDAEIMRCARSLHITIPFNDRRNATWLRSLIIHTASMKKRKLLIRTALRRNCRLFGDPEGWQHLFGKNITTHDDIDYAHQLSSVYHDCAVNLNITSCQMPTAVNQRIFDVPLSGSFLLTDRQSSLPEMFETGSEVITYESAGDLLDKFDYYRSHDRERRSIIRNAVTRIRKEHTYSHRLQHIESVLT
ncbi:MAG: glycosyltransferase [Chitinivibrionales bacterium]|nr:glycosyltransferase [Chitinivibrionales bacterium]